MYRKKILQKLGTKYTAQELPREEKKLISRGGLLNRGASGGKKTTMKSCSILKGGVTW